MGRVTRDAFPDDRVAPRRCVALGGFRRVVLALGLGLGAAIVTGWVAPFGLAWVGRGPGLPADERWWTDGDCGGRWFHAAGAFSEIVDLRRVLFSGPVEDQPFFDRGDGRDRPPGWAGLISLDQREGFEQVVTYASGWPWRGAKVEIWIRWPRPVPIAAPMVVTLDDGSLAIGSEPEPLPAEVVRGGWVLGRGSGGREFPVPRTVLWPGLAGNVAVFGGGAWLLLAGAAAARRGSRRREGRCVGCGYSLEGVGAVCPECGRRG